MILDWVVQDCQLTMSGNTCYFPASFVDVSRMPPAKLKCLPQIFTASATETVKCSTFSRLVRALHISEEA